MKAAASCPFGKMQKDASQSILFLFQNIFSRLTYKHQNEDDY